MIFWDSSAIVRLLIDEPYSAEARVVGESDGDIAVWWATPIECLAAIARRERLADISQETADEGRRILDGLRASWLEIQPEDPVRTFAAALVLRHDLRAADALQLAAAMTWCEGEPSDQRLFTFDQRLASAARREGFDLVRV